MIAASVRTRAPQSPDEAAILRALAPVALPQAARASLAEYVYRMFPGDYDMAAHHELIIDHLEAVERGEIRRLLVTMPPRRGKSLLCSEHFPAWYLGRNPDRNVIACSHTANLAYRFSRKVRRQVAGDRWPFPGVRLRRGESSVQRWGIDGHEGGYQSAGVGGSITGDGADLLVVDDPVKGREHAESSTRRDMVGEWYESDALTRLSPAGAVVLIQCMTGDTPVRMANGTERPLRDIRPGDRVATYRCGELASSTVQNHASQGHDNIFRITMTSGKVVHANERHPFLVEEHGQRRWAKLRDLITGHRIVTLRDSGASGRVVSVPSRAVASPLVVGDSASHTTSSRNGPMGTAPPRSTRRDIGGGISSIGTASPQRNTNRGWPHKMASALSVGSHPARMSGRIGAGSCVSIIATRQAPCAGSSAMIATLPLDMPSRRQPRSRWLNTSDFTTEAIASIEPAGVAEVFDVQIADTENFIANGLVSHNTRWHSDDLAGRQLDAMVEGGDRWTVLSLPEIAEDGEPDALGRTPGAALWPTRYPVEATATIRATMPHVWWPLFQQRPAAATGKMIKRAYMSRRYDPAVLPAFELVVLTVDSAFKEDVSNDASAWAVWGATESHLYLIDAWSGRVEYPELIPAIKDAYAKWEHLAPWVYIEDAASGQSAIQTLQRDSMIPVRAWTPKGSKVSRAQDASRFFAAGRVLLPSGAPWLHDWIEQHAAFPTGKHDDLVDTTSTAIERLTRAIAVSGDPDPDFTTGDDDGAAAAREQGVVIA